MPLRPLFLPLFSLVLAVSCEGNSPITPTKDELRLVDAYAALVIFHEQFPATTNRDSTRLYEQRTDSILTSRGYTRGEFRSQLDRSLADPVRFQTLFQELHAKLQKEAQGR